MGSSPTPACPAFVPQGGASRRQAKRFRSILSKASTPVCRHESRHRREKFYKLRTRETNTVTLFYEQWSWIRLEILQRIERFVFYTTLKIIGSENLKEIALSSQD